MSYEPDKLQKIALGLMGGLVVLTFTLANVHALLWQSSDLLVGAVLPGTVVELTNEERKENNLSSLQRSAVLDRAAQLKAQHMAQNGYFAHYAPDGTSPWYWFDQVGYTYAHAGENLAIHFTDSDEVVEAWMNSPTHRANIVDSKFTEIGVGTAKGRFNGHRTVYVVQLFGTPAYVPPTPAASTPTPAASPALATAATTESAASTETTTTPEPVSVLAAEDNASAAVATEEPTPETVAVKTVATEEVATEAEASAAVATEEPATQVSVETPPALESSNISVSSGLPPAPVDTVTQQTPATNPSFLSLATQPNTIMQVAYTMIALAVFVLLLLSFVNEMKHAHPVQMAYSVAMLLLMVSLYWLHTTLTEGAIVV